MTLDEIAATLKERTDKGSADINDHNYLVCYEKYVSPIRDNVKCLLELGVDWGASIDLWGQYFPNARVHGVELFYHKTKFSRDKFNNRFSFYNGDYANPVFLSSMMSIIGNDIDIIVDDGAHDISTQVIALKALAPYLSNDGYYFLEDLMVNNTEHIVKAAEESGLVIIEDYCDVTFKPLEYNVHHLIVLRKKT